MICKIKKMMIAAFTAAIITHKPTHSAPIQLNYQTLKNITLPTLFATAGTLYWFNEFGALDRIKATYHFVKIHSIKTGKALYTTGKFITSGKKKYLSAATVTTIACKIQPKTKQVIGPVIGYSLAGYLLYRTYKKLTSKTKKTLTDKK